MTQKIERNKGCPICNLQFYITPAYVGLVDCNNCGSKLKASELYDL